MKKILILASFLMVVLAALADSHVTIDNIDYYIVSGKNEAYVNTRTNSWNFGSPDVYILASVDYEGNSYPVTEIRDFYAVPGEMNIILHLPASIKTIGRIEDGVSDVKVDAANPYLCDVDGVLYSKDMKVLYVVPYVRENDQINFVVPEGVEEIWHHALYDFDKLQTVSLPSTLKKVGERAFYSCSQLSTCALPDGLEIIESEAFHYTILNTSTFKLPANLRKLGANAFYWNGNASMSSLTVPEHVETIERYAFGGISIGTVCTYMPPKPIGSHAFGGSGEGMILKVPRGTKEYYASVDSWRDFSTIIEGDWDPSFNLSDYAIDEGKLGLDNEGQQITQDDLTYKLYSKDGREAHLSTTSSSASFTNNEVHVPESVEFRGRTYSVTGVENFSRSSSSDKLKLFLPKTVKEIDRIQTGVVDVKVDAANPYLCDVDGVLYSKDMKVLYVVPYARENDMINFVVPEGVEEIWHHAMYNFDKLQTVSLPSTLKKVGENAFYSCNKLSTCALPDGLEIIESDAFQYTILNTSTFKLPANVRKLGNYAFGWNGNASMSSLTVPEHVETIESYAFGGIFIGTICSPIRNPKPIGMHAFGSPSGQTLVVPTGTKSIYETLEGWKDIEFIFEEDNPNPDHWETPKPTVTQTKEGDFVKVKMSAAQASDEIYYTIDGNAPVPGNYYTTKYETEISVDKNCLIQAVAKRSGYRASAIDTCKVESFVVADVEIKFEGLKIVMSTSTSGATIRYRTDGQTPSESSGSTYSNPFTPSRDCTVIAIAYKSGYTTSQPTTFVYSKSELTVKTPEFKREGNYITITSTEGASIYYTDNNTTPTQESIKYSERLEMKRNCTLRAIAVKDNMFDSSEGRLEVDWFVVDDVRYEVSGKVVKLICDTPGAEVRYTLDGKDPTSSSTLYSSPVTLTTACTVKAKAFKDGYTDSNVTSFVFDPAHATEPAPHIEANVQEHKITITAENGATIYYTLDGTAPTTQSIIYTGPFEVFRNGLVRAIATRENFNNSPEDTYAIDWFKVESVQISITGATCEMKVTPADAEIYYTLDGRTSPSKETGTKYTGPFVLEQSCTIMAVGVKDGYKNSDVKTYNFNVGDAMVPEPVIRRVGDTNQLEVTDDMAEATIYYTLDGTSPTENSRLYDKSAMITVESNVTVKAIGTRRGYSNSPEATFVVDWFRVSPVTISVSKGKLHLETATSGAQIYYTLDGTDPTASNGTLFEGDVTLKKEKCTIQAIGVKDGFKNSEVSKREYDPNAMTAEAPTFKEDRTNNTLTLECATAGADIYYTLYDEGTPNIKYEKPIQLTENCTVRALAKGEDYFESETVSHVVAWFSVAPVEISDMDENFRVTLNTTTPGATIYYTTNGNIPTAETATEYRDPFVLTASCTVKAIAVKKNYNTPEPAERSFTLPYAFDGVKLQLSEAGITERVIRLFGLEMDTLVISGPMNNDDLTFIRTLSSLRYLDMQSVEMENGELPNNAFANMQILVFVSPEKLTTVGRRLFANCQELAAVLWNASVGMPDDAFGNTVNPNLLVYAKSDDWLPKTVVNRIVNGTASKVVLSDGTGEGNTNFYCPKAFTVKQISYTHNYTMTTERNVCRGWETIALPFTAQTITHERNGALTPFYNYKGGDGYKPFWLYQLTETGFVESDSIRAYEPYIISMPNNANYADSYILSGEVTFAATDVRINETKPGIVKKQDYNFVACFQRTQAATDVFAINRGETYGDYLEGSVFVSYLREVRPFEAYKTSSVFQSSIMTIFDYVTGIQNLTADSFMNSQKVKVYNLTGVLVTQGEREEVLKHLPKGLYIINGQKTLIK